MGDFAAVGAGSREIFGRIWISADLIAILLLIGWAGLGARRWLRPMAALALSLAFVLEVYEVFILRAFSRMPVLYNDILLIWDGLNLAFDLLPGGQFTTFAVMASGSLLLVWSITRLLVGWERCRDGLAYNRQVRWVALGLMAASLLMAERSPVLRDAVIQSSFVRAQANIVRSHKMHDVMKNLSASPAAETVPEQLQHLTLRQTPDIYILVVESYGAVLFNHPELSPRQQRLMQSMTARLEEQGYSAYSQLSISPVIGGASWQATSTLLSGIQINNQHLYTSLYDSGAYGLPAFLGNQGYATWTVQAGYRTRPGRPVSNPWGYDHTLYFDELDYHGHRWGWGVVPDQYALGFAGEKIQAAAEQPHFMMFTGVSTHVPWNEGPGLAPDWRVLGRSDVDSSKQKGFWSKIKDRFTGKADNCLSLNCFQDSMTSEWEVLTRFIESLPGQELMIVIVGDHQPPVLPTKGAAVPLHFITRGVSGMVQLEDAGFVKGLVPPAERSMRHEGLLTLIAEILSTDESSNGERKTVYRPGGASPASLVRAR